MILTEEEIKEWNVPRERLNEKYLNTRTKQVLPYDEIVKITDIASGWDENPLKKVELRIQQGIYVLVEDEKAVVK